MNKARKMKRLTAIFSAAAIVILMLGGCAPKDEDVSDKSEIKENASEQQDKANQINEEKDEQKDTEAGEENAPVKIDTRTYSASYRAEDDTVILTACVKIPVLSGENIDYASINQHYENQAEKHMAYAEDYLYKITQDTYEYYKEQKYTFEPTSVNQNYEIRFNKDDLFSVTVEYEEKAGGQVINKALAGDTFRLSNGTRLSADDLFNVTENEYRERILSFVLDRIAITAEHFYETAPKLAEICYQKDSFYLTEDAFCVVFQAGELSAEIDVFEISYEQIADIINI